MSGGYIHLNRWSLLSLLLVLFLLAMTALPALAWFDEGVDGQRTQPCRVLSNGEGKHLISCGPAMRRVSTLATLERPLIHPAVARAEQMFERYAPLAQVLAEH